MIDTGVAKDQYQRALAAMIVQVNMGTLYPGLMGLEQRGFISGTWGVTENKRRARFYAISAAGRRQLAVEKQEWNRTATIMQALLSESK